MGVSCVYSLPIPSGKSGQHMIELISKQLETFGAQKCGQFYVECDTYYSVNTASGPISDIMDTMIPSGGQTSRILSIYHSSEYPLSCFALLDTGLSLVADASFDAIVMNLSAIYSNKKMSRFDCRGQKWSLSDFAIRIGSCSLGPQFKGVLLEVEYRPSVVANHCWDLIKELAQSLCCSGLSDTNQWMASKMNDIYSPIDTIQQYNHYFNQLRKAVTISSLTTNSAANSSLPNNTTNTTNTN
ncbi:mediator of RNA polymerase II transcription subunit 20-like [Oppia nitens]|uniref:mediator of RNA polymerase II transcription subunit 20-like n=1 Tax=Oppia nitens TaxID=1686743 RepID=UPI0023DC2D91|nr:mediator of RNA polymerase II transcription subunit 20-like [Oppia nitens]